ncbi:DUF4911 domain-containing protein [Desulfobulbus alkaliphilus]|uniref:DUF4911 domain-containing protein n=1 Tax=Desulfobulbus alkaliphilus TaxID=869814 RepID=UPI0019643603|nr:DUF4911 domain-containing protein [Desulfobulbus alkaliphilus]MBM9537587.1 DUF4911 domain-containing protein [Desulfobulbus alkaliphilus]
MHPKRPLPVTVEWYLLIRPEKISLLRFILEGYDGLATMTTISARDGLVRMRTFASEYREAMELLDALAPELTPFLPADSLIRENVPAQRTDKNG